MPRGRPTAVLTRERIEKAEECRMEIAARGMDRQHYDVEERRRYLSMMGWILQLEKRPLDPDSLKILRCLKDDCSFLIRGDFTENHDHNQIVTLSTRG